MLSSFIVSDSDLIIDFIREFNTSNSTSSYIDIVDNVKPMGLSYGHLFHSIRASSLIGSFEGKRVLEMGGALPEQFVFDILKASSWSAVEYNEYIGNQFIASTSESYA